MNIAEILKDCPKGIKLYSPIFGEVFLDKIKQHLSIVVITDKEQGDFKEEFLYDGRYGSNGECMLFPSNDQRDWTKFQIPFKDGDILADKTADNILCIYKAPMHFNEKYVDYYCGMRSNEEFVIKKFKDKFFGFMNEKRLATEEEKEKLFNVIKANGYKWNAETKTLEKLVEPKFKIGDMIKYKNGKDENGISCGKILSISDDTYDVAVGNNMGVFINIADQENWQLDKIDMEDFVNFEVAKKLKEKGFSCKYPFAIYFGNRIYYDYGDLIDDKDAIIAPTISQVLKWLREEKKISIEIGIHCLLKWMCSIYAFSDGIEDFTQYDNDGINDTIRIFYNSYEQAALAGIEYVLDNLI